MTPPMSAIAEAKKLLAAMTIPKGSNGPKHWRDWARAKQKVSRLGFSPATLAAAIGLAEGYEKQGLLLNCLETVCVELSPVDRAACGDFIEQIAAHRRTALAAFEALFPADRGEEE